MNFQELADSYQAVASVLSVRQNPDGSCGEIRVVAGNQKYVDVLEHPKYEIIPGMQMDGIHFIPNTRYDAYFPKDPEFEALCFRAAVRKETTHTYLHPQDTDLWFDVTVVPIEYEEQALSYCLYITNMTDRSHVERKQMPASSVSDDVLKTCLKLYGADDFKKTMDEVIHDTRVQCGAEICTILLMDYNHGTYSILASDLQEHSKLKRVTEFQNYFRVANSWMSMLRDRDCLIIRNADDMAYIRDTNPAWWETLVEAGVTSLVLFPLQFNQEVLGFIWATNFNTDNTERIKETLDLTTFFISSHIASYKLLKRLEHIGYTDMLTGVRNRNAMNNRVSGIVADSAQQEVPFGVVFADLNGLKTANDTHGHSAGDLLLKKAALLLQELFAPDDIYRAGGDEFIVLIQGCSREDFRQQVQILRERADLPNQVSLAVGCCYAASGGDVRDALRLADEDMYQDKQAYYRRHPEFDRRKRKHA